MNPHYLIIYKLQSMHLNPGLIPNMESLQCGQWNKCLLGSFCWAPS